MTCLRRLPALAAAILAVLALAAEARAAVVVTRGAGAQDCPDGRGLARRVGELLASESRLQGASFHVEMQRTGQRYRARIDALGAVRGTREIEDYGSSCASLAEAVAVSIAIVLDAREADPPPEPPAVSRRARPALAVEPLVGIGMGTGLLSAPVPIATAGVVLWPVRALAFGLSVTHAWPDSVHEGSGSVELGLDFGSARTCLLGWGTRDELGLRLCGAVHLGVLRGRGEGFVSTDSRTLTWSAVSAGGVLHGPKRGPLSWWLGASGVGPLVQHAFDVEDGGSRREAFRSPAVGALLELGLRVLP